MSYNRLIDMLHNITIIILIYLSGSIYFISLYYNIAVVFAFLICIFVLILTKRYKAFMIQRKSFVFLLLYAIFMLLTIFINQDYHIQSYLAIYIQMLIALLVCKIIPFIKFKEIYINIISLFALFSLIFHFIGLMFPEVVYLFPKTDAIASTDYYNAVIHVYQTLIGYDSLVFNNRNAGIFWEPGAYQAFLNIGLLFLLDEKKIIDKFKRFKLSIIILAVISTQSATGYIVLLLILFSYRSVVIKLLTPKNFVEVIIFLTIFVLGGFFVFDVIRLGFTMINDKYIIEPIRIISRISLDKFNLFLLDNWTIWVGMSFSTLFAVSSTIWNSIIQTALVFGVPFAGMLLYHYCSGSRYLVKKRWLLFLVLIIIFSTESLFWRPFFLYFAFVEPYDINNMPR